jgi:hypothetical protein
MRDGGPAVLESKDVFFRVMSRFVANECQDEGVDSISFLLAQIKQIVNLFQDMGLHNLIGVYNAVVQHTNTTFEHHSGWKICSVSGIPSRKTGAVKDVTSGSEDDGVDGVEWGAGMYGVRMTPAHYHKSNGMGSHARGK